MGRTDRRAAIIVNRASAATTDAEALLRLSGTVDDIGDYRFHSTVAVDAATASGTTTADE